MRNSLVSLMTVVWMVSALGCADKIEPGRTPSTAGPAVKTAVAAARLEPWPLWFEAAGTVQAGVSGTLAAKLMGTVTAVHAREGQRVRRGDLLVTIDERQVFARRQQAEAALAEARQASQAAESAREAAAAGAELAATTFRRYQTLLAQESVSLQEFDEVESRFRQARAASMQAQDLLRAAGQRVRQAEAALAEARVFEADAAVTAPFDGVVAAKMVDAGDLAAPGRPLVTLEQEGGHRVDVRLPEALARALKAGGSVLVNVGGPETAPLRAVVEAISPAADPESRTFLVKVRLPAGADARSGMFARVAVAIGEEQLIAVPASAVVREGQLTGVFLVTPDNIARYRLIRTGRRLGERIEVVSGLPEGSRFVVTPPPGLTDGARVEEAA
ncbi:MAG: efflux RND transporter periplasmic adaptor subunit [Desulfobacterales bacterium]